MEAAGSLPVTFHRAFGGGVRDHNVRGLIDRAGEREVHARFIDEAGMGALGSAAKGSG